MNLPSSQNPQGLNQTMQDPLAQLRDIHLPEEISQWPLALGWNMLIVLLLALIICGCFFGYRYWRASRYKREALKKLHGIQNDYKNRTINAQETAQALSDLYRRIALSLYPREKIAPLHGIEWLEFLNNMSKSHFFTQQEGQVLSDALFKKITDPQDEQAKNLQTQVESSLEFGEQFIRSLKVKWGFKHD
jgi:hypothetical protein